MDGQEFYRWIFNHVVFRITEIQSANQNRSRTLREERDDRQRQMAQLQQDMANLPSEAVSGIVGDYAVGK